MILYTRDALYSDAEGEIRDYYQRAKPADLISAIRAMGEEERNQLLVDVHAGQPAIYDPMLAAAVFSNHHTATARAEKAERERDEATRRHNADLARLMEQLDLFRGSPSAEKLIDRVCFAIDALKRDRDEVKAERDSHRSASIAAQNRHLRAEQERNEAREERDTLRARLAELESAAKPTRVPVCTYADAVTLFGRTGHPYTCDELQRQHGPAARVHLGAAPELSWGTATVGIKRPYEPTVEERIAQDWRPADPCMTPPAPTEEVKEPAKPPPSAAYPLAPGSRWEGEWLRADYGCDVRVRPDIPSGAPHVVLRKQNTEQSVWCHSRNVIAALARAGLLPAPPLPGDVAAPEPVEEPDAPHMVTVLHLLSACASHLDQASARIESTRAILRGRATP